MEEQLNVMEGRVRGVVLEARTWNARERELIDKAKEESMLAVQLAQREQMVVKEQKETAARLARAEKRVHELEEELAEMTRYIAARQKAGESGSGANTVSKDENLDSGSPLPNSTSVGSLSSILLSGETSGNSTPSISKKGALTRGKGRHQRSESVGAAWLRDAALIAGGKKDQEPDLMKGAEMVSAPALILSQPSPPPIRVVEAPSLAASMRLVSPRGDAPSGHLRVTSPNLGGSVRLPPKAGRLNAHASRRKSMSRVDAESVSSSLSSFRMAEGGELEEQPLRRVRELSEDSGRRRRAKSMRMPASGAAAMDDEKNLDGISAETLAEVEAEIAMLLGKKK